MEKVKKFLSGKGVGYYLTLPGQSRCVSRRCACTVKTGSRPLTPSSIPVRLHILSSASLSASSALFVDFKPIRYVAYLFCLYAFMWFIYSQVTYIANIFVAIDGYTFSGGFIATAVMYVLSFLFTLLAAILNNWKPWGKKAKEEVRA